MNTAVIETSLREKVGAKTRIAMEGDERFRVFTPFLFEDGDHLAIVLKKRENMWVLSDEGHTYMHLTCDLDEKDFQKGTRQKIIGNALSAFRVEDRDGEETVPDTRRVFNWHDPVHDPHASYAVDYRIDNIPRPAMVFALSNDDRTRDATIALLQFEKWGLPHQSLGIFEDQEQVNRKVLSRFTDVCEKQFSSLTGNRDRIVRFPRDLMETGARQQQHD